MSQTHKKLSARVGDREIHIESGKLAKLADGAALVTMGETVIIVTAVSATKVKDGQDFFPLTVEYKEKAAAVGRIPGSYFRREGRPTEKEILTCRMIDRPLRPLFPKGYFYDTQIIAILLSADGQNDPDILAMNGASAALMVSDIPWAGPIGAVRVARVNGQFIANPTHNENAESDLDLVYVGTEHESLMIEGSAKELPEADFKAALEFAQQAIQPIIKIQKELAVASGKKKRQAPLLLVKDELLEIAYSVAGSRIEAAIYQPSKVERHKAVEALKEEVKTKILEKFSTATPFEISQAFDYLQKKAFRTSILDKNKRCDGRPADQIRNLTGEVSILPRSHGSSLFARGETQAVCLATLGPLEEAQEIDAYTGGESTKRFLLHYNFPPFSVGETGRFGGQSRREIGHGALAERSLEPVIPSAAEFGYAVRVVSEIMESNGSTSMASVCGGTLALLDAGVPLKAPVAGISVGLVTEFDASGSKMLRHQMLTDIIGSEDHFGDMDFKLCGTSAGVTGFQLDLKLAGLPLAMLKDAIDRATTARQQILKFMASVMPKHRDKLSPYAPQIEMVKIPQDKIGLLIGPGGKTIKGICAETGAEVNVEDDGTVRIYANTGPAMARAKELISGLTGEIEVGKTYKGRVVSLKDFGAFVEIFPGRDGLVHISELAEGRVERVDDAVKMGDLIEVKCIGVDDKGRVKLSRKAVLREAAGSNGAPGRN
jgi:polyribonucleotide nucleotidyltransferase